MGQRFHRIWSSKNIPVNIFILKSWMGVSTYALLNCWLDDNVSALFPTSMKSYIPLKQNQKQSFPLMYQFFSNNNFLHASFFYDYNDTEIESERNQAETRKRFICQKKYMSVLSVINAQYHFFFPSFPDFSF